jgi:hypothetical protein
MYEVTTTFLRVFDITRMRGGVMFGFEDRDGVHFCVRAPYGSRLEPGATITALLGKPGDWKTASGWVDRGTGRIHMRSSVLSPLILVVLGVPQVMLLFTQQGQLLQGLMGTLFMAAGAVGVYRQARVLKQLKLIQARPESLNDVRLGS